MNNMERTFDYGIVTDQTIMLFNESVHEASPINSHFLKDVKFNLSKNGICRISANRIVYDFYPYSKYGRKTYEKDWIHTPHSKLIHTSKSWWKSLLNIGEEKRFVYSGWVRTTETEIIDIVCDLAKYTIEIYD